MKKLFVFAVLIALTVGASAQWSSLKKDVWKYTGQVADTANGSNVKNVSLINVPTGEAYYYLIQATLDEFNGSATAWAILEGSLDGTNYYLVDTLESSAANDDVTADGRVYISDFSTGLTWPYLRVQLKLSTTGRWNFDYVHCTLVGKND